MHSLNRVIMHRRSRRLIEALDPANLRTAEISGRWGATFNFAVYDQYFYPDFDICQGPVRDDDGKPKKYDFVMANQVWEHLDRPYAATRHVRQMLKKGGHFWVAVPFFIPFHAAPNDCSRWSARGLTNLLIEAGFDEDAIVADQWGNRHAAQRNLEEDWPPRFDKDADPLDNDPTMPICAWAMARKT
ncbi:MAG: methyltransferase domain-containing protein [Pseudomonadota bacterium]